MNGIILGFSGSMASGKTSLSKEIANYFNWPRVSFGDFVRSVARNDGLDDSSREILQEVGESLIKENVVKFCEDVIKQIDWSPGQSLVIDGIRHEEVLKTLKKLVVPSKLFLVFIKINENTQNSRLKERSEEYEKFKDHSTEKDVETILPKAADLIVDGTDAIDALILEVISWLNVKIEDI